MSNKKHELVIILVLIIAVAMTILPNYLASYDEIWVFNFGKNFSDGRLPYKDFNIIQGPLLPMIFSVFFKMFGTELIVMRFLGILLSALLMFMIYKILKRLGIQKYAIYVTMVIMYLLFFDLFCIDYNLLTILIILIAIYYEIKRISKGHEILEYSFKFDFCLGIFLGASILLKQTSGLFISVIFILYKLLLASNKEDFKTVFKIILTRFFGVLIPAFLLYIYLIINNIWMDYLEYTVYSIKTFSNYIPYTRLFRNKNILIVILSIMVPISFIYMYIKSVVKKITEEQDKFLFVLFAYSVATFVFVYPISDSAHFLIGSVPALISISYIIWNLYQDIKKKYNLDKSIRIIRESIGFATYVFIACILITSVMTNADYIINIKNTSHINHYKYIRIDDEERIKVIGNYILESEANGKKVYMLDAAAALYMIPIDRYNKNYDMFLKGNIGTKSELEYIEELEKEENIIVIIVREEWRRNWQLPTEVVNHIIDNWEKTEELLHFDVYEK